MKYGQLGLQRQASSQLTNTTTLPCYACQIFSQDLQRAISSMFFISFRDQQRDIQNLLDIKIAEMRQHARPMTPQSQNNEVVSSSLQQSNAN